MIVRRILLIAGILFGLVVVFFGAEFLFPQIVEAELKLTCPMTAPSANCQVRMVSMGHVWALRGNLARAAVWYSRAAEAGNPAAMFHLAWAHEQRGYHGFKATLRAPADPDGATAFKEGPDRSVEALRGAGFQLAAKWYRKSADQGFAPAMNNLGELYLAGVLGRRDVEEAFRWHLAAARAGNPIAAANVSLDYRMGRGVAVDEGQAREWATFLPRKGAPDLGYLTLRRTEMMGSPVDDHTRHIIVASAEKGLPVTINFKPLRPDPPLPTFGQVQQQLR